MTVSTPTQHHQTGTYPDWPGLFIVFEGIDGTGKTSQLVRLANFLRQQGESVVSTREPSNGPYGTRLRQLFCSRETIGKEEELQLFLDDRHDHLHRTIIPALADGAIVLCDRYFLSTVAYQGATGRFSVEELLKKNSFAPVPDIALLFQAPISTCLARITIGRGESPNDFEQYHSLEKAAEIFSLLDFPWLKTVDCNHDMAKVEQNIQRHILPLLKQWQQGSGR